MGDEAREDDTEAQRLMRAAMAQAGATTAAEFARFLGGDWLEPSPLRKLDKWRSGKTSPNFEGTMMLLRLTGRLREDEEAEAAPAPRDSVADRLQSLEATVEEQGEATTRALHDLTRQIQKLERRLARGAPQAKAAGE